MAGACKETVSQMIKMEPRESFTGEEVTKLVDAFKGSERYRQYADNFEYFKGQNPFILSRVVPESQGAPDNRIPVSYGRRIINIVTGYMYRPGLVQYTSEDEQYFKELQRVFDVNLEPIKTEQIGKQTSIQGVGYEFHYVTGDTKGDTVRAIPRFTKLPATEVIPIYDNEVEPKLWGFIRFIRQQDKEVAWFYTDKAYQKYAREGEKDNSEFIQVDTGTHYYGAPPLVVYRNNEETIGDFEPVTHLIDAYDVLVSDSMNEFDRFSFAYLVMKGMSLSQEDAERLKRTRVFENLGEKDAVEFLTKEMATEFIQFMTGLIRNEIHRQSGIPNLEDYDASGASGKTMSKFIYLMELFTDPKESYFKTGLYERIVLIDRILAKGTEPDPGRVSIVMNRNTPDNSLEQAEIFNKFAGFISQRTLIENFADFVDDVDEEMEQVAEEGDIVNAFGNEQGAEEESGIEE